MTYEEKAQRDIALFLGILGLAVVIASVIEELFGGVSSFLNWLGSLPFGLWLFILFMISVYLIITGRRRN